MPTWNSLQIKILVKQIQSFLELADYSTIRKDF